MQLPPKSRAILSAISTQIDAKLGIHSQQCIADVARYHQYVMDAKIDWQAVADQVSMNKKTVYHWYHKIYTRDASEDKISVADKERMK